AEDSGVACVIDGEAAGQANDEAAGFASIERRIEGVDGIRMKGVRQRNLKVAGGLRATFAHAHDFFVEPLGTYVKSGFMNRENFWVMLLREGEKIAEVVGVGVREENGVEATDISQRRWASGIG